MFCKHCHEEIHTPDDRTGLIHTSGLYGCFVEVTVSEGKKKTMWIGTVAE